MSNTKSNQQSSENKGAPTQSEQPKGVGGLPVSDMDEETRKRLEQEALDAGIQDPNRNLDKPELDKPAYGGGH
ncbi:hypothetical protein ACFP2F_02410 [Hymenobacter artigasi]|uniref:Uncharacterized protein n=1 Tax=Hymenobacter artigasi TaxID=2719616 RepID=A0ABX1HCI3_9BACT|nr:hypothetical protein [Hymenobacter artigasi]NKI87905.1 hypothetical protein [Hymenobacter artigasi]